MPPSDPFVDVVAWPMLPPRLSVGAFSNCSACPSELRRACMKLHESLDTLSSSQAFREIRNTSWTGSGRGQYPLFALTRGPLFAQARGPGRYQPSVLTLGTDGSCPPLRPPLPPGAGYSRAGVGVLPPPYGPRCCRYADAVMDAMVLMVPSLVAGPRRCWVDLRSNPFIAASSSSMVSE